MLMEVKNQIKISLLSIKYALMREMLNKATFIMNIIFMILNNSAFIIQWLIIYSIKGNVGGYELKQIFLLWGIAAGTYGFSHFFFKKSYDLADIINTGKLDAFLVQPKNVLISAITTDIETSALGDIIYGFIMLIVSGFNLSKLILFIILSICGGLIATSVSIILSSLSFWFQKTDIVADRGTSLMTNFATYPEGIFKGIAKVLLFTIIPVGFANYIPVRILSSFDINLFIITIGITILFVIFAFLIFYKGLKKYSSSNLMVARI